jgi:hypothetical protein
MPLGGHMNQAHRLAEIKELKTRLEIEERSLQRELAQNQELSRDELISIISNMREMISRVFREGADPEECRRVLWYLNTRMFDIEMKG